MNELPIRFQEKVKQATASPGGYPFQISSYDLDLNFAYCAVDVDESSGLVMDTTTMQGGLPGRRISYRPTRPFQILWQIIPNTKVYEFGVVNAQSRLFNNLVPSSYFTISGLLNANRTEGWQTMPTQSKVYLEISFTTGGLITTCEVKFDNLFDVTQSPWQAGSIVEKDSLDRQTKARKLIGYTEPQSEGSDKPQLFQTIFTQQALFDVCINGFSARYPFPHEGGYSF
jgi:hypothetical protein